MLHRLIALYRENPREGRLFAAIALGFLAIYFIPAGTGRFDNAVLEAVYLTIGMPANTSFCACFRPL